MRYYLDEDLAPGIAVAGRELGVDVVSAHECGAQAIGDEERLARAADDGRCLVTFSQNDLIAATRKVYDEGGPPSGILVVPPQSQCSRHGMIAKLLAAHAAQFSADDLPPYSIVY